MIFFIRFITAACLFAFLGKANIWLNSISNVILATGYRFFLVLSPSMLRHAGKYSVSISLLLASIGTTLFCFSSPYLMALGAILVGIGLSISGYLIKSEAAESPSGAAYNKIALNAGSLLSGIAIALYFGQKNIFFMSAALLLFISCIASFFHSIKRSEIKLPLPKAFNLKKFAGWLMVGISIGIKLFGVFSVLPQYLIAELGKLPNWYGLMIFLNSVIVILLQYPIIHFVESFSDRNLSLKITIVTMLFGMILIGFPQALHAETLIGALIWTALLSIVECFASYLDVAGSRAGYLLVKETSVGLGAGLTVLVTRYLDPSISGITIGLLGIGLILSSCALLHDEFKSLR